MNNCYKAQKYEVCGRRKETVAKVGFNEINFVQTEDFYDYIWIRVMQGKNLQRRLKSIHPNVI